MGSGVRAVVGLAVVPIVVGTLARAGVASTPESLADAATAGLRTESIYVHPEARQILDAGQVARLRERLALGPLPIYVAVLPPPAAPPDAVARIAREVEDRLARRGVVVVVGRGLAVRASSDSGLDQAVVGDVVETVRRAHGGSSNAFLVLVDLVDELHRAALETGTRPITPNIDPGGSRSSGGSAIGTLVLLALLAAAVMLLRPRRTPRLEPPQHGGGEA